MALQEPRATAQGCPGSCRCVDHLALGVAGFDSLFPVLPDELPPDRNKEGQVGRESGTQRGSGISATCA